MKRLLHLFIGHNWKITWRKGWDLTEPHNSKYGSDYLPTGWREYKCSCGMKKRNYRDRFTHLGTSQKRVYIFSGEYPELRDRFN